MNARHVDEEQLLEQGKPCSATNSKLVVAIRSRDRLAAVDRGMTLVPNYKSDLDLAGHTEVLWACEAAYKCMAIYL